MDFPWKALEHWTDDVPNFSASLVIGRPKEWYQGLKMRKSIAIGKRNFYIENIDI